MTEFKPTKKICSCCRGDLPLDDFRPAKSGMFGVASACKFCHGYKNRNLIRKKKGLDPLSIDEYRIYMQRPKTVKEVAVEKINHQKELEKKIETKFAEKRVKALAAHEETERLKRVIKDLKKDD